ncbi:MAG: hypothetical protein EPO23_05205 [Xanthobacteraceae bacterium]|nr:MAG: hypothetical protein EPO23_05205 [Xanthobacteraceae bacterium]
MDNEETDTSAPLRYAYKPSLMGGMWEFELGPQALVWRAGRRHGRWPYGTIAKIRLSYRPQSIQNHAFRADITNAGGERIALMSTTWQGIAVLAPQNETYRAFLTSLHGHLAQESRARFITGMARPLYVAGMAMLGALALAMAGLLARALMSGVYIGALFLVGFAALFMWQSGTYMRRNRPGEYSPRALPPYLLP